MKNVFVAFSHNPTIKSTETSLISLARSLAKNKGVVKDVVYENNFIYLTIEEGESKKNIHVIKDKNQIKTTSFVDCSTNVVKNALLGVISKVLQYRQLTLDDIFYENGLIITLSNKECSCHHNAENRKTLLLIDGSNVLNRAYYATRLDKNNIMKTSDGRYVNGIYAFMQMMHHYINQFNPSHFSICFDEGKSWRKEIYPEYKNTRKETPGELKHQFDLLKGILRRIGVKTFSDQEYEADDFISTLKHRFLSVYPNGTVIIISNDKDLLQLIDKNTKVVARKKRVDVIYTPEQFESEYPGLQPKQIIDLKAIEGDASDNIKGIPGIGEAGALKLIQVYNSVEKLIEKQESLDPAFSRYKNKILTYGQDALFYKKIIKLKNDITDILRLDMNELSFNINVDTLIDVCKELQFNSIIHYLKSGKWNFGIKN